MPQIFNRNVMRRNAEAARAGHRLLAMPHGDVFQLAGTFILDQSGEMVWGRPSEDISDNVYADEIRAHLPRTEHEAGA